MPSGDHEAGPRPPRGGARGESRPRVETSQIARVPERSETKAICGRRAKTPGSRPGRFRSSAAGRPIRPPRRSRDCGSRSARSSRRAGRRRARGPARRRRRPACRDPRRRRAAVELGSWKRARLRIEERGGDEAPSRRNAGLDVLTGADGERGRGPPSGRREATTGRVSAESGLAAKSEPAFRPAWAPDRPRGARWRRRVRRLRRPRRRARSPAGCRRKVAIAYVEVDEASVGRPGRLVGVDVTSGRSPSRCRRRRRRRRGRPRLLPRAARRRCASRPARTGRRGRARRACAARRREAPARSTSCSR